MTPVKVYRERPQPSMCEQQQMASAQAGRQVVDNVSDHAAESDNIQLTQTRA